MSWWSEKPVYTFEQLKGESKHVSLEVILNERLKVNDPLERVAMDALISGCLKEIYDRLGALEKTFHRRCPPTIAETFRNV